MAKERETWVEIEVRASDGSKCFVARALSVDDVTLLNDVARDAKLARLGGGQDAALWALVLDHGLGELGSYFAYETAAESTAECIASLDAVRHYLRQAG